MSYINIENPGHNYVDGEKMYVDIFGNGKGVTITREPAFFIIYSKYPHTRYINTNSQRQFSEITEMCNSSVTKNSAFSGSEASLIPSIPKEKLKFH